METGERVSTSNISKRICQTEIKHKLKLNTCNFKTLGYVKIVRLSKNWEQYESGWAEGLVSERS